LRQGDAIKFAALIGIGYDQAAKFDENQIWRLPNGVESWHKAAKKGHLNHIWSTETQSIIKTLWELTLVQTETSPIAQSRLEGDAIKFAAVLGLVKTE
jgi:hypothetical protein